eukprot:CAMPEP_0175631612 /NCGR_PEP_ID=MMETSP0096-20121207/73603_1 /TAXON_ID=311494 /ORGANISM="Alexandrium monilatum, Strain CCMP3105" /LENGTH=269 /DNA_ID=CAMNT_0016937043 /DNA_START=28 /DNA_END=833 /DNA_ORIENTATION=-
MLLQGGLTLEMEPCDARDAGRASASCQSAAASSGWAAASAGRGVDEQDTATPGGSTASEDTEASVAEGAVAPVAPVKNTFIHYDCDEQPDYRPCVSGPAYVSRRFEQVFAPLSGSLPAQEWQEQGWQEQREFTGTQDSLPPLPWSLPPVGPPTHVPAVLQESLPPLSRPPPPVVLQELPAPLQAQAAPQELPAPLSFQWSPMQPPAAPQELQAPPPFQWSPMQARETPQIIATVKNTFIHFDEEGEQPGYRPVKSGPAKLLRSTPPEEP